MLTFEQRYANPSANALGKTEEEVSAAYRVIYSTWRSKDSPSMKGMEDEILMDSIAPIGSIGMMTVAEGANMGWLNLTHVYERYQGVPGKSHQDRRTNFALQSNMDGKDAYTFAIDKNQLGLTPYMNVPQMLDRHMSLLEASPTKDMVGPFVAQKIGRAYHPYSLLDVHPI
jgi:hypothetical protein